MNPLESQHPATAWSTLATLPTPGPDRFEGFSFPSRFGRYRLLGVLGMGGMARVFDAELVRRSGFRKPIALKVAREDGLSDRRAVREALTREARIGALLSHPNLVPVIDFGQVEGRLFLAMERVRGQTLAQLLRAEELSMPQALGILGQVCEALGCLHDRGLVHRDVKPANVMVEPGGLVRLLDLGGLCSQGSQKSTAAVLGSPSYMAPEQVDGGPLDARTDVFAVGALLWESLTGRRFFHGDSLLATIAEVRRVETLAAGPRLRAELDPLGAGLTEIVRGCLRLDPQDRYPSCRRLAAELTALRLRLARSTRSPGRSRRSTAGAERQTVTGSSCPGAY